MLAADWLFGFGGTGQDWARAGVATDADDNVYVAGDFSDTVQLDPNGSPAGTLTSNGSRDVFVAKYDSSGNFVWARSFGGSSYDFNWGLALDDAANVILSGGFRDTVDFDPFTAHPPEVDTFTSAGDSDGYVLKLDTDGEFQWVERMIGDRFDNIILADIDRLGNIYVGTQTTSSQTTYGTLPPVAGGAGEWLATLAKLDADGTYQWVRDFQNGERVKYAQPVVNDLAADPDDWTVSVTGTFMGELDLGFITLVSNGDSNAYLAQVDAETGQQTIAATQVSGTGLSGGLSMDLDASGNIYVAGTFSEQADFDTSSVHANGSDLRESNGDLDIFILKMDPGLNFLAVTSFGGAGMDSANGTSALAFSPTGDVLVGGQFEGQVDFSGVSLVSGGETDGFLLALDGELNLRWADRFGGAGDSGGGAALYDNTSTGAWRQSSRDDGATGLAVDSQGNLYVAGDFKQTADFSTGDRLTSSDDADAFLMRLDLSRPRISGNIFGDFNANGLRDDRLREGIFESDGWLVELVDDAGDVVAAAAPLGNSGNYSFGSVDPGTYTVRQYLPSGWVETVPGDGHHVTVAAGDVPRRLDFGNYTSTTSETYSSNDVGQRIRSNRTITSDLTVPDTGTIFDINVQLDVTHTFDGDLETFLIAPDGTEIELFSRVGGSNDNFSGTILDDDAAVVISESSAPFNGRFRAEGNLAALAGKPAQGIWTLRIADVATGDQGMLNSWSLEVFGAPPLPPAPSLSVNDVSVNEGDSGTATAEFTVTRSGDLSQTVTVDYVTADDSATAGSDYTAVNPTTLTFDPGVATLPVSISVYGDVEEEPDETFIVNLSNAVGATIEDAVGVATIIDNDSVISANTLFVYDIRFESKRGGRDWRAVFEIRSDSDSDGQGTVNDAAAAGVSITVTFAGVTYTGTTDSTGVFRTSWERNLTSGSYYANVVDLQLAGHVWNSALDLEDDSDEIDGADALLVL